MLGFAASSGSSSESSPSSTSSSVLRLKVKRSEPLPTYSGPNQIPPSYEQATGKKTIRSPTSEEEEHHPRRQSSLSYWLDLVVSQREAQNKLTRRISNPWCKRISIRALKKLQNTKRVHEGGSM